MDFHQFCALLLGISSTAAALGLGDFDWEAIEPNRKLKYYPCYEELQCARLIVPLDWQDETNNNTVAVAIAKLPAKVPEDDPSFGGTIFANPGGPGGTGVGLVLRRGHTMQDVADGNKHYEILSWDPRGVGFTSPKADCYKDTVAREIADLQEQAIGPLDSGIDVLRRQWARTRGYGRLCEQGAVNGSILPFLTTSSVARDMVEMLDKVHELRDETTRAVEPVDGFDSDSEKRLELRKTDVSRIQYWGFSYGTILGNTFASMFPGRVGRLILDGIGDADDYVAGTWLANLQDTEKVVEYFYKSCFEAGDKCALTRPSDTEWTDMKKRVDSLIDQADLQPFSILQGSEITIITGNELRSVFTGPLYSPLDSFHHLARTLSGVLDGNFTFFLEDLSAAAPKLHDTCALPNSSTNAAMGDNDALNAIMCGDGEDATHLGISYFQSYIEELKSQSPTLGVDWSTVRFTCSGWGIRPKWRFTGPFTTPEHDPSVVEGKPVAPLLFLSSRYDPASPLRNAVAMAARHPGAVWVVQESAGHCAISTPSKCTNQIIRDYLEYGIVPKNGTACEPDCDPWNPCEPGSEGMRINLADEHGWPKRSIPRHA